MRLFAVEVRRLLARRLFRVMAALVFAALAVTIGSTGYQSHNPTTAERAQAAHLAAEARKQMAPLVAQCRHAKATGQMTDSTPCSQIVHEPTAADFLADNTFLYKQAMRLLVAGFGVVLSLFGFVVGASFIGAEWSAGTLPALLTWEPRRVRVFAAKALALAVVVGAVGVAVMTVHLAGFYGVAFWRGRVDGVTQEVVGSLVLGAARGVAIGVGAALAGFGIAGLVRSTAGAIGAAFAYAVGAEIALRYLWAGAQPWLITTNAGAFLLKGFTYYVETCRPDGACNSRHTCSHWSAARSTLPWPWRSHCSYAARGSAAAT